MPEPNARESEPRSEGDPAKKPESPAPAADTPEPDAGIDWKQEMLTKGKPAQEEANRLRRELEEKERRIAERDAELERLRLAAEPPPAATVADEDEERLQEAARDRQNGFWARQILKERQARAEAEAQRREEARMAYLRGQGEKIEAASGRERRELITKHFLNSNGRFGDIEAARADIENGERAAEITRLKEERDAIAKERDALKSPKPKGNGAPRAERSVTAEENQQRRSRDEWNREREEKLNRGDRKGALAMDKQLLAGEVELQ